MKNSMFDAGLNEKIFIKTKEAEKYFFDTHDHREKKSVSSLLFYFLLSLFFLPIILRLLYLQVFSFNKYRLLSDGNRIRQIKIPALRGIIYDRNKKPLVYNWPIYRKRDFKTNQFTVISRQEALLLEGKGQTDRLLMTPTRDYLYKEATAHLIGYIGEISKEELDRDYPCQGVAPEPGDFIGKSGVEKSYECFLKGKDGARLVEVDTYGKILREIGKKEPINGNDLVLSIDLNLQLALEKEMKDKKGTVVVSNPSNGEILALYSSPSFNPNLFTKDTGKKDKEAQAVLADEVNTPLINRAIAGVYPPGSTFKIIVATAGLQDGKVLGTTLLEDTGVIKVGQWEFPNWLYLRNGQKEGFINLVHALKRSNDVFFYRLGEKIGINRLNFWTKKFGLGKPLGIDLPNESTGTVPDNNWKVKNMGEKWYLGDTYHLSIGQGFLLVTPLQVNFWTSVIANGGKLCQPTVVNSKFKIQNSKWQIENQKERNGQCRNLKLDSETIRLITEGMRQACQTGGTAWPLFDFKIKGKKIPLACKTGTAEFGDPKKRTHAWFTVFVLPGDLPAEVLTKEGALAKSGASEIAVTVLVEAGGEGSDVAAPIAGKVLEEWFK